MSPDHTTSTVGTPGPAAPPFGFNLVGYASANLGLGVILRNTAAVLESAGYPFCVVDTDPGGGRYGHDHSLRDRYHPASLPLPYPVTLFHLNPPELSILFQVAPTLCDSLRKMNVCVLFWELPLLPPPWVGILSTMDLILAPSRFVQHTLDTQLSGTPCRYFRQGLARLPDAVPDRRRWGLRDGEAAFLYSFDATSDFHRKNPVAPVNAFSSAFRGAGGATLFIKMNNAGYDENTMRVAIEFRALAVKVPGVRILDEVLTYAEVLSLYSSIDVYVSLHRSEGLGLSLMECMALGKPVIATAWSGNMDFMDDTNSCLIRHTLVPVEPGSAYHHVCKGISPLWADPSVDDAARWMARLAGDPALRAAIGARAREAMRALTAEANRATALAGVRAFYEHRSAG